MSSSPSLAAPASRDAAAQQAEDTQRHRQALADLIDMGMDLARMIHGQAKAQTEAAATVPSEPAAPAPPSPMPDLTAAFDRISRCVRRTILLAQHIAQPPRPAPARAPDPVQAQALARKQLIRGVEDRINHNRQGPTAEALHREFLERLDTPDLIEDIATRPIPELIKDICNDLGLSTQPGFHPHRRRRPEDLARLHDRAQGHHVPEPPGAWPPRGPAAVRPKPPGPGQGPPLDVMVPVADLPPALAALLKPP